MDANVGSMIAAGGISGTVIAAIYIAWKMCKHSRCKSACCGHESSLSVDLDKGFETRKEVKPVIVVKE